MKTLVRFYRKAACHQRTRLAAVLAFEKLSARQPKPIRIIDDQI